MHHRPHLNLPSLTCRGSSSSFYCSKATRGAVHSSRRAQVCCFCCFWGGSGLKEHVAKPGGCDVRDEGVGVFVNGGGDTYVEQ